MKTNIIFYLTIINMTYYAHNLVDITTIIPDITLDIKYATPDNFTGKVIYPEAKCFLLSHVAQALKKVQADLKPKGYKLKIFDGFRPIEAQRKMWQIFPDERYVLNPDKGGGRHTRGTTVDLTIIKLDGSEVEMPTSFDYFGEEAHSNYKNLPENVIKNRELLKSTMKKHGFQTITSEWWHFDFKDWEKHEPLELKFQDL